MVVIELLYWYSLYSTGIPDQLVDAMNAYLLGSALHRSMFNLLVVSVNKWPFIMTGIDTNGHVIFGFFSVGGVALQIGKVMPCLQLWSSRHSHLQLWILMRCVVLVKRHFNWQPKCARSHSQVGSQTSGLNRGKTNAISAATEINWALTLCTLHWLV